MSIFVPDVIKSLSSDAGKQAAMSAVINRVQDILSRVGYKDAFEVRAESLAFNSTSAGEYRMALAVEFANKHEIEMEPYPIFTEQSPMPPVGYKYKDYFTPYELIEGISSSKLLSINPDCQLEEIRLALERMSKNIVDAILHKHCKMSFDEAYTIHMERLTYARTMIPELVEMSPHSSAYSVIEQQMLDEQRFRMQAAILAERMELASKRRAKEAKELRRKRRRFTASWGM